MNDTSNKLVRIGDRVRWTSAAGTLRGEVVDISLGLNGYHKLIPWITIERTVENRTHRSRLCGTDSYLKMMDFKVTFRDFKPQ